MRILSLLLTLSCVACAPKGPNWCPGYSKSGPLVSIPAFVIVHTTDPKELDTIVSSVNTWNTAAGKQVLYIGQPNRENAPTIEINFKRDSWVGQPNQQGVTYNYNDSKTSFYSVVDINAYNWRFDSKVFYSVDLESIMLHELGHAIGIEHSDDPKAAMYPYLDIGQERRSLDT